MTVLHTRHTHTRTGFTLVEIIVSLAIFAIVATVALGALVKIVSANKKAQAVQEAVTSLNFALDAMSREMRVGRNYYCQEGTSFMLGSLSQDYTSGTSGTTKCPVGDDRRSGNGVGHVIAFNSSKVDRTDPANPCNLIYAYALTPVGAGYSLSKAEQASCGDTSYAFNSIVDPNVTITGYYVRALATYTNPYPRMTIRLSGYAGVAEKDRTYFDVQTTVSARVQ